MFIVLRFYFEAKPSRVLAGSFDTSRFQFEVVTGLACFFFFFSTEDVVCFGVAFKPRAAALRNGSRVCVGVGGARVRPVL